MKHIIKYIFLLFSILIFVSPVEAKKKQKKQKKSSISSSVKKKFNKTTRKKTVTLKKGNNSPKTTLKDLLNETKVTVSSSTSDSVPDKVVTILSAFKPQLKNVAKIGFFNATALVDTLTNALNYQVPSQNLNFEYRPISLVPRAIVIDSSVNIENSINLTLGFGNYAHHFAQLNFNTIDQWKNTHSFTLLNEQSIGTEHHLQKSSQTRIEYLGSFLLNEFNTIQTQLFYNQNNQFRYGLVPDSSILSSTNFAHNYEYMGASFILLNTHNNKNKLHIQPSIKWDYFKGFAASSNTFYELNNPMFFQFKNKIKFNVDLSYSFNQYNPSAQINQKNTLLKVDPFLTIEKWGTTIKAGVSPVWMNKVDYHFFPNVFLQKKLTDTNYIIKIGWTTLFDNTKYANLAIHNPWIVPSSELKIFSNEKKYISIDISSEKKYDFSFGVSINEYKNLPFFNPIMNVDFSINGLKYQTIFEKRATTLELDAVFKYQLSDRLLWINTMNYKQFNLIKDNSKPWGILPLTFNTNFNWIPNKKWILEATGMYWTGTSQLVERNKVNNLKNVLVLNAGFTYLLTKTWKLWAKGENLLDKPYERWSYYPTLGAQISAGIIYTYRK